AFGWIRKAEETRSVRTGWLRQIWNCLRRGGNESAEEVALRALTLLVLASEIDDRMIGRVFAATSEQERLAALGNYRKTLNIVLSLLIGMLRNFREAVLRAFELVLRRKGIVAEGL